MKGHHLPAVLALVLAIAPAVLFADELNEDMGEDYDHQEQRERFDWDRDWDHGERFHTRPAPWKDSYYVEDKDGRRRYTCRPNVFGGVRCEPY